MQPMLDALPQSFDFYHLGRIELEAEKTSALKTESCFGIAYRLNGEARALLVLLVDEGLDVSIYSEAGNIIASRLATVLGETRGLEVTVSPPQVLTRTQLKTLMSVHPTDVRIYTHHRQAAPAIELRAVILPASVVAWEATGNA